jgi:DNA repair protein RecN (Recombination protein N)
MIRTLRVQNLAVIEELELEFGPGLNVITGETGAGKSVLLGALALLRGGRISSELTRTGASQARVEAIFDDPALLAKAREHGLGTDADDELVVWRTVSREGRGRVHVNGSIATASLLEKILGDTIEVIGQGEHQSLRADVQGIMLDRFAGLEEEVGEITRLYRRWMELGREIGERRTRADERLRREDQLRFEIDQIRGVDPGPGEVEALESEQRDRVAEIRSRLAQAAALDPTLREVGGALERAELELNEALRELQRYEASLEVDPTRLEVVETRLAELARLQKRYGPTVEEILQYESRAREELDQIGGGEARLLALQEEQGAVGAALARAARSVSERRAKAGTQLSEAVEAELAALDLRRARFEVHLQPPRSRTPDGSEPPAGPRGGEVVEFWFAPNPGEEARRLREAASGGERARVLLALRSVLREADGGRILLFDEVDAGIGGRTARRVGERLRGVSRAHQVVCITHLPQIAALGDTHARIFKRVRGGRTITRSEPLAGEARVEEIARIAGGGRITNATRAHARELLGT